MTTKQEKIQDKLQFIGLLGPVILLLTLFCTLLKGSPKSGYLFFMTLFALPALWQWRLKGFLGSLASLFIGVLVFTSFFSSQQSLWQVGAALSIAIGLFITYMGFEELKASLEKLKLESQSRLDNLIQLDEKFEQHLSAWESERAGFVQEVSELKRVYERTQEEVQTLERLVATLREELKKEQVTRESLLQEQAHKQEELSKYESEILQVRGSYHQIEQTLKEDRSEREKKALLQLEQLKQKFIQKEEDAGKLQSQLQDLAQQKTELEKRAVMKDDAFKSMQEALREKVSSIHELHEKLQLSEQTQTNFKKEIEHLLQEVRQKEHDHLTMKDALRERDLQLQNLNQKHRDLQQDLTTARTFLEAKKNELLELKNQFENEGDELKDELHRKEDELSRQAEYISQLEEDSQKQQQHLKHYAEENEALAVDLEKRQKELEEQKIEFEQLQERESKLKEKQFNELRKLNEARFALFQSSLDQERYKQSNLTSKPSRHVDQPKHWLLQLEQLLKGEPTKKINFSHLPKDLSEDILTLHQTKSLYKQLRAQFDEKNEILEETRKELFHTQKDCEEVQKRVDEAIESQLEPEKELHKSLEEQIIEVESMEKESEVLHEIISKLLEEKSKDEKTKKE